MHSIVHHLFLLNFLLLNNALPFHPSQRELARRTRSFDATFANLPEFPGGQRSRSECGDTLDLVDDCPELPAMIVTCLNNCANCVKQWKTGVYNGHICANDCIQQEQSPVECVDPECNLLKYFNSTQLAVET